MSSIVDMADLWQFVVLDQTKTLCLFENELQIYFDLCAVSDLRMDNVIMNLPLAQNE